MIYLLSERGLDRKLRVHAVYERFVKVCPWQAS